VNVHFWQVLWLAVVGGIIAILGLLGLLIGVLFTVPIFFFLWMQLYEEIFALRTLPATGPAVTRPVPHSADSLEATGETPV
jgi:hypothetical protein